MTIATCAVKRGFFVLRDCGGPAANQCSACQRPVCMQHLVSRGPSVLCLECNANQQQLTDSEMRDRLQDPRDSTALYNYRHGYYRSYGYNPFYGGVFYDDYYDDYDVRSFDQGQFEDFGDDDDDDTAGFGDS